jgi:hypothetical protein
MSKSFVFASYDRAAQCYMQPFFAPHAGVAVRGFTDAIKSPKRDSDISLHPDDFDLYELGEFDNVDGIFALHKAPKLLVQGKQVALTNSPEQLSLTGS